MSDERRCSMCGRKLSINEGSVCSKCAGDSGKAAIGIISAIAAIGSIVLTIIARKK